MVFRLFVIISKMAKQSTLQRKGRSPIQKDRRNKIVQNRETL